VKFTPFLSLLADRLSRYWDETVDAANISNARILDPVLGFGGDGVGVDQCVSDGPFSSYVNPIGPAYALSDHCIERAINQGYIFNSGLSKLSVGTCLNTTSYVDMWHCVEPGPHSGGHGSIGAEVSILSDTLYSRELT